MSVEHVELTIRIPRLSYDLLTAIGEPVAVIEELVDHAQQGVYRPGAWERGWLEQAFGRDFQKNLELDPVCYGQHWTHFRTKGTKGQANHTLK